MNLLKNFKKQFDREINVYLDNKIKKANKIDKKGSDLFKIIKEFVNHGGKRLRPAIFYYSFSSYSSQNLNKILRLSFIFELFHSFALIHDDIIDNSDLRRGSLTVHKKYDLATAILAGDLSLMLADEIFFQEVKDQKIINLYNEFKQELLVGEYLDTIKIDNINKIMELKTARYTFVKLVMIALHLAKVNEKEINKWKILLREVGILFQIKDDYDGVFGDENKMGKSTNSDLIDRKNTLIIKRFLEKASSEDKKHFNLKKVNVLWLKKSLKAYEINTEFKEKILNDSKKLGKRLNQDFQNNKLTKLINEILVYFQSTM